MENDKSLSLEAFEQVVMTDLAQIQEEEKRKVDVRDKVDIAMIGLSFILIIIFVWAKLDSWAPVRGPLPIAGVVIRRILKL